ncbi:MAG: hypothetical protein JSW34_05455, partial [Candidatus Zixiibacteriota bacterium]
LAAQGIPAGPRPPQRTVRLVEDAIEMLTMLAAPRSVFMEITRRDFGAVFEGEGLNDSEAPLGGIYERSDGLALFAVTLGRAVSRQITDLFDSHEYAAGAMLDSTASESAELAATSVERTFVSGLDAGFEASMSFSPGYCGWHISAQKKLFETLQPVDIGITLTDTFLMQPLKSISGVIVAGRKEIFIFDDNFEFCSTCRTRTCRDRMNAIKKQV